jgi:hypothetical protein
MIPATIAGRLRPKSAVALSLLFYMGLALAGFGLTLTPQTAKAGEDEPRSGSFTGKSSHEASGSVRVSRAGGKILVELQDDFRFDGAPDPKLAFGKDGYVKDWQFSHLSKNSGAQRYELADDIDLSQVKEVWIWCEKYSVPLGVAELE